jgi:hypothetical protein
MEFSAFPFRYRPSSTIPEPKFQGSLCLRLPPEGFFPSRMESESPSVGVRLLGFDDPLSIGRLTSF